MGRCHVMDDSANKKTGLQAGFFICCDNVIMLTRQSLPW